MALLQKIHFDTMLIWVMICILFMGGFMIENNIRLVDVLTVLQKDLFDAKYHNRRRKLRFNISWQDEIVIHNKKVKMVRDFKEMYLNKDKFLEQAILSIGTNNKKRLNLQDVVFQFIEIDTHKWLFIGAYQVINLDGDGFNELKKEHFKYANAIKLKELEQFSGRLVVDFINKPQQFYYTSDDIISNVVVSEILPEPYLNMEEKFVGYEHVNKDYKTLFRLLKNKEWKENLSNVFGVYVLTDKNTGKHYVGSATGSNGIYGRWAVYLDKGYDDTDKDYPNKKLKELVKSKGINYIKDNFQYSILEIFPKTELGKTKALEREVYWKDVLKTREFGYNDN